MQAAATQLAPIGTLPHFNGNGDLVIGLDVDAQFKYWLPEGQTIWQTLADLNADAATVRRYTAKSDWPLHTAMGVRDCKGEIVESSDGQVSFCVECGWFIEGGARHNALVQELGF